MNLNKPSFKKSRLAFYLVSFVILLSAGCTFTPAPLTLQQLTFNALIFDNISGITLNDVSVNVENSGAHVFCSVLLTGRSCSTGFKKRVYKGNAIYLSWKLDGRSYQTQPFHVTAPAQFNSAKPASVVISFSSENNVAAEFRY